MVGTTADQSAGTNNGMVLAGVVASISRGVLSRLQIPVTHQTAGLQAVGAAGALSIWRGFAKGTYLDKSEVTERVLKLP